MDLSAFFTTKSQANDFSGRLGIIAEKVFTTDFNFEKALMDQFGLQKKDMFMTLLRDNKVTIDTPTTIKKVLDDIQTRIAALPTISLTIAFEPREETLQAVTEWFMMNLKKQIVCNIIVDQHILGGAAITYNGKYIDCSIKPVFEKILEETVNNSLQKTELEKPQHQSLDHLHLGR